MGLNGNLVKMIGAPKQVICPKCASGVPVFDGLARPHECDANIRTPSGEEG